MKTNEKLPLINGNCLTQKQERRKDLTKTALMCVLQSNCFYYCSSWNLSQTCLLQMGKKTKPQYQQHMCRIF